MLYIKSKINPLDKKIADILRESTRKYLEKYTKISQYKIIMPCELSVQKTKIEPIMNTDNPNFFFGITIAVCSFLAGYHFKK